MPFLWCLFFFILFNNLLGMVPLDPLAVVFLGRGHIMGTATAGLSVTAGLALVAFVMIHVSGILEQVSVQRQHGRGLGGAAVLGFLKYWYNFVPHIPGAVGVVLFVPLLILELIGALVKPFALAIRLFANMMAGHVVLASLLVLAPAIRSAGDLGIAIPTVLGCAALGCLELFVAFLQAYIFVFLTSMFIGAAVSPDH
jgi:F-type H+-transporting ATPase subunit a